MKKATASRSTSPSHPEIVAGLPVHLLKAFICEVDAQLLEGVDLVELSCGDRM